MTLPVAERLVSDRKDLFSLSTYVKLGDDSEATRVEIQLIMDDYKVVEQLTLSEYADVKTEQIAQFLYVVYALLAVAGVIVGLFASLIPATKAAATNPLDLPRFDLGG